MKNSISERKVVMNSNYILFVYHSNYPIGGIDDVWGVFSTLEEAKKEAKLVVNCKDYGDYRGYRYC